MLCRSTKFKSRKSFCFLSSTDHFRTMQIKNKQYIYSFIFKTSIWKMLKIWLAIASLENGADIRWDWGGGHVVHHFFPWTHKPVGALMSFWLQCSKHCFPLGSSLKLFFFFCCFLFFKGEKEKKLTVHMKHSRSCLVCSPLPPQPLIHQTPTYQKKAPQLLKTHWPRQGLLSKTDSNKLNQWHGLEGASFTLQTMALSPGRRWTGTRKTVHDVSEAEETSGSGARGQRSLPLLQG